MAVEERQLELAGAFKRRRADGDPSLVIEQTRRLGDGIERRSEATPGENEKERAGYSENLLPR